MAACFTLVRVRIQASEVSARFAGPPSFPQVSLSSPTMTAPPSISLIELIVALRPDIMGFPDPQKGEGTKSNKECGAIDQQFARSTNPLRAFILPSIQ